MAWKSGTMMAPARLEILQTLKQSFQLMQQVPHWLFLGVMATYAPLVFLNSVFGYRLIDGDFRDPMVIATIILVYLLVFLAAEVGFIALLHAVYQQHCGLPVEPMTSLRVGLQRFLPMLAVLILMVGAIFVGLLLLLVPGILLTVRWFAAVSVTIFENKDPWQSFARSSQLTEGHRWAIFGILLAMEALGVSLGYLLGLMIGSWWQVMMVELLVQSFLMAVNLTIAVIIYERLRQLADGDRLDRIVGAFA